MTVRPRKGVAELDAYELEPTGGLNLANNASTFPPNPAIRAALDALDPVQLRDYPSLYGERLCARLAELHDVTPEHIVTGNGSNDLIDLICRTFTDEGARVAYHPPSFSMIPTWARTNGAVPTPVPLGDGFSLDVEAFAASDARVGFVCRPNNPTGNAFPLEDVEAVAEAFGGLLVVDEAYVRFSEAGSAEALLARFPHVALLRSLSKDAGLAGIRLGYTVMAPEHAAELRKVRGPFRVPALTEHVALTALDHLDHVRGVVGIVREERARVAGTLTKLGLAPFPTEANFVLFETPWPGTRLAEALRDDGVLVRDFGADPLANCIRVTVGPREANDRFLEALQGVLDGGGP